MPIEASVDLGGVPKKAAAAWSKLRNAGAPLATRISWSAPPDVSVVSVRHVTDGHGNGSSMPTCRLSRRSRRNPVCAMKFSDIDPISISPWATESANASPVTSYRAEHGMLVLPGLIDPVVGWRAGKGLNKGELPHRLVLRPSRCRSDPNARLGRHAREELRQRARRHEWFLHMGWLDPGGFRRLQRCASEIEVVRCFVRHHLRIGVCASDEMRRELLSTGLVGSRGWNKLGALSAVCGFVQARSSLLNCSGPKPAQSARRHPNPAGLTNRMPALGSGCATERLSRSAR